MVITLRTLQIPNWINGNESKSSSSNWAPKINPHDGTQISEFANSTAEDIDTAVLAAKMAFRQWSQVPPVERGHILHQIANLLESNSEMMATEISLETGKSMSDARGEVAGAVAVGRFFAGEGQRLFGRTTTSGLVGRLPITLRCPIGVAGLVVPANTPIANIAWKVFPALICGNSAVLKSSEDAPGTAWNFGKLTRMADLPPGVLNIVHGFGPQVGAPLIDHHDVRVVSFTGSTSVGLQIAASCALTMKKVSLELGGKNPIIVCADSNIDLAVSWAVKSAFSNAGQRCASGSRIIVEDAVYDQFISLFLSATKRLTLGCTDADLGPVINMRSLNRILAAVQDAIDGGAKLLIGGKRSCAQGLEKGCYVDPTILEVSNSDFKILDNELFGPVVTIQRVNSFPEALEEANRTRYGLTSAIHTGDWNTAMQFVVGSSVGVATVNGGTFGSEPHLPFGGLRMSGNGTREPGTEALDVYSDLKTVYLNFEQK